MASYNAPLREMRLVLDHIVDMPGLSTIPAFAEASEDMVSAILEEAGRFNRDVIAPLNEVGDAEGATLENGAVRTATGFADAWTQFSEGGWSSLPFDPAYGGQGLPWSLHLAVGEMLASANMSFSLCPMLLQGAIEAISHHGSDQQKSVYLENLISGKWTGTMNLTESQAGSDLGVIRTSATPQADGSYRIKGSKIFITYGEHDMVENIVHLVLARTPDAPAGSKGISLFIVPKFLVNEDGTLGERNDLRCVSLEHKLGIHASPTCVMAFGDDGDCVGYLVGEENKGLRYMFTMMNNARLGVGLQGVAIGERAYQRALAYALERQQGKPLRPEAGPEATIFDHADVRRMLMTMKALTDAARSICFKVAGSLDRANAALDEAEREQAQDMVELLTPVAKSWSTDIGVEVASLGIQVHGGLGFIEETGAAQHLRDARIAPIYEGTNGIQAMDLVMRKVGMKGGDTVKGFLSEMRDFANTLGKGGKGLAEGVAILSEATDWMLENLGTAPNACAAGATPYLNLFGLVAGGYYLSRLAAVAEQKLKDGDGEEDFFRAKIAISEFYGNQILPRAAGFLAPVTAGEAPLYALTSEQMAL